MSKPNKLPLSPEERLAKLETILGELRGLVATVASAIDKYRLEIRTKSQERTRK
jgi:hypothetical protein